MLRGIKISTANISLFLCAASVAIACTSLFLMGFFHIPVADDLSYSYVFHKGSEFLHGEGPIIPADSFAKIIDSQIYHYFHVNGRSIVHLIVQCFAGLWGYEYYNILSPVLLAATLILLVYYTCPKDLHANPFIWLIAAITWLYLYPSPIGSFHWLVYGMNYLYPMCLVLCFLSSCKYLKDKRPKTTVPKAIAVLILGLLTGWSQEGFAVPIAGAMFIYVIIDLYKHKKLSTLLILMSIGLWIGTTVSVLAPGNFIRLGNAQPHSFIELTCILFQYSHGFRLFWPSLIIIILAGIVDFKSFKTRIKEYTVIWICLPLSILFSIIAHSGLWSFMSLEFYTAVVMFSTLSVLANKIRIPRILTNSLVTILLILISIHQYHLIHTAARINFAEKEFIEYFRQIPPQDKKLIVASPDIVPHPLIKPWTFRYWCDGFTEYNNLTLSILAGNTNRIQEFVGKKDYDAIFNPEKFFTKSNLMPGNSGLYDGNSFYWAKSDEFLKKSGYRLHYSPVRLIECPYLLLLVKAILTPNSPSFVESDLLNYDDIVTIQNVPDSIIPIRKRTWRNVVSITCDN